MGMNAVPELVGPALDASASCYKKRASLRVEPTRQKAELRDSGKLGPEDAVGTQNMLLQSMPLWHEDYFETEGSKNQQLQGEDFLELSFSDSQQEVLRDEDCHQLPLLGTFYEEDGELVLRWTCSNLLLALFPYIYLASHGLLSLGDLKPFPLSCHFSTNLLFFVKTPL